MLFNSFIIVLVQTVFLFTSAQEYATVTVAKSSMSLIYSDVLPGNLLPNFLFQQGGIEGGSVGVKTGGGRGTPHTFMPDDSCGDDIFEGAMEDMRSPQLPYLTQDQWTCDRINKEEPTYIMENEQMKVTITPQYDGKVWAMYDKTRQKELLYNNKAKQPANIGALKAWSAGGAEWNWSPGIIGHSAFSETQVFMGKINTKKGPVVRVYEYDRYNGTTWQVDMLLLNDTFIAHPRVTNPTAKDLRGYWWTCVAVDSRPSTRIFAPATHVAETSRDPMRNSPWPYFAEAIENATFKGYEDAWMTDNSYIGNHQIGDMFLRIPADQVYSPYIAHNQDGDDGFTFVHGHPLNGTKFFTWGQSGPGRFMQDFLAGGQRRQGDYTELQVGPAPTQMQNFPVPKQSILEWTEWFKGFKGDENVLRGEDYQQALSVIDSWMQSAHGMPRDVLDDLNSFFHELGTQEVDEILVEGQPWGALEEKLLGHQLTKGLHFKLPSDPNSLAFKEAQPWVELLSVGKFSADTLKKLPLSYQTTDNWLALLEKTAGLPEGILIKQSVLTQEFLQKHEHLSWLHALHLGIAYAERGDITKPQHLFQYSFHMKANPIAARNLAVLTSDVQESWKYFQLAWKTLHSDWKADTDAYARVSLNLVNEISFFLQQNLWYDEMESFAKDVNDNNYLQGRQNDAFITLEIKLAIHQQRYSDAQKSLSSHCFPTYAKARDDLMSMWNNVVELIAAEKKGTTLTSVEKHQARKSNRIPDNIGCQYASMYCDNYW